MRLTTDRPEWRELERQLAEPTPFGRLLEQEEEAESDAFLLQSEMEAPSSTASRKSGSGQWDRAVVANRNYARSLTWQVFRSSIVGLLGFTKSFPDDNAFAAAVARWQSAQGGLTVDGIIGPKTISRMYAALRSAAPSPPMAESSAVSLHNISADPGEIRRAEREWGRESEGAEGFSTRPIPGLSDGHTTLTRQVASSFKSLTPDDVAALEEGSAKPDDDFPWHDPGALDECEQRRHALRGRLCQEVKGALQDIRGYLAKLYTRALATSGKPRFVLLGEALHLIQDSYSPAHTERDLLLGPPYLGAIVYIRVWNPLSPGYPTEHGWPADIRDRLELSSATGAAVSAATREFLQLAVGSGTPGSLAQLNTFMDRHLVLSSSNQTLAAITRWARRLRDQDPRSVSYGGCLAPDRPKICP